MSLHVNVRLKSAAAIKSSDLMSRYFGVNDAGMNDDLSDPILFNPPHIFDNFFLRRHGLRWNPTYLALEVPRMIWAPLSTLKFGIFQPRFLTLISRNY